jgi:hypothetical protein
MCCDLSHLGKGASPPGTHEAWTLWYTRMFTVKINKSKPPYRIQKLVLFAINHTVNSFLYQQLGVGRLIPKSNCKLLHTPHCMCSFVQHIAWCCHCNRVPYLFKHLWSKIWLMCHSFPKGHSVECCYLLGIALYSWERNSLETEKQRNWTWM